MAELTYETYAQILGGGRFVGGGLIEEKDKPKTRGDELLLKEHESLHKEVEVHILALRKAEDYCLLAVGGVWTWLISYRMVESPLIFLPTILTFLFYMKRLSIDAAIRRFHSHLMEVEKKFAVEGWEHHIHNTTDWIGRYSHLYYWTIFVGSVTLAISLFTHRYQLPEMPNPVR